MYHSSNNICSCAFSCSIRFLYDWTNSLLVITIIILFFCLLMFLINHLLPIKDCLFVILTQDYRMPVQRVIFSHALCSLASVIAVLSITLWRIPIRWLCAWDLMVSFYIETSAGRPPWWAIIPPLFQKPCPSSNSQPPNHTPSIAFRHLPPNSARFSCATEGALFISTQLSTDAVSALQNVWVLIRLEAA